MKIPKSLDHGPYRQGRAPEPLGPPAFRTAVHRPVESGDPKRPPTFETSYREMPIDQPGYEVRASDRSYVTTPEGALRRGDDGRQKSRKPLTKAQRRASDARDRRQEEALVHTERRRLSRTLGPVPRLSERRWSRS